MGQWYGSVDRSSNLQRSNQAKSRYKAFATSPRNQMRRSESTVTHEQTGPGITWAMYRIQRRMADTKSVPNARRKRIEQRLEEEHSIPWPDYKMVARPRPHSHTHCPMRMYGLFGTAESNGMPFYGFILFYPLALSLSCCDSRRLRARR